MTDACAPAPWVPLPRNVTRWLLPRTAQRKQRPTKGVLIGALSVDADVALLGAALDELALDDVMLMGGRRAVAHIE